MLARTLDFTARHAFLPLLRILDKDRSLQYLAQVEDLHGESLETIQNHQLDRLQRICTTAAAKSPFYETRFREAGVSPEAITFETLKKLPVLTREDLHRFPKGIRNRDYEFEDLRLTETGGTTFAPVKFYLDQEAYN
ncbi:MAG: hypothetical protein HKN21_11270, partial [Candidatus Eisenbacteria bacterium]|nr:hypothetical protein [Candidatus Eisenbacteria bacterium]